MRKFIKARIKAWLVAQVGIESIDGAEAIHGVNAALAEV